MDLSIVATPLYLGSMAVENRSLKKRARALGPTPADYFRPDTIASLAMGIASAVVPLTDVLGRMVVPGKGRFGKVLIRTAVSAVVITTVADRIAARSPGTEQGERRRKRARAVASAVVHHSSQRYNLSTALRQPVASSFGVWVPVGMMARIGVRPSLIAHSRAINLIYQFWIHTDLVGKLGPASEAVLNTPSHHRAQHGSNKRYLDRNHGCIVITWDRLFGIFQRERDDDPVVYGLTKNIETYNPWRVATHEFRDMFRDVANSTNWRDRLSFVLRGPGWAYARHEQMQQLTATDSAVSNITSGAFR